MESELHCLEIVRPTRGMNTSCNLTDSGCDEMCLEVPDKLC